MFLTEGLQINESKTERYHIQRGGEDAWKKCKYLGSLLDTEEDIKREKGLTTDSYKTSESIFSSKHVSEKAKIRVFATYIKSIFMYNSELSTLTQTLENSIVVFQRKLLRRRINVKWPRTISNKDLYARTEMKPWSITIHRRRLTWIGHLMRLPAKTPAREALKAFINPVEKPPGREKTTWVSQVLKEIKLLTNLPLKDDVTKHTEILECSDRSDWRSAVSSMMLTRLTNMQ